MAQDVLITPASTKIAFTDSGDTTTVLKTSSGRFEFKDSGESNFVDIYANDIVLDGNLTVGGTTTTVNTSNILIEDPILQLAKGQTSGSPSVDIGFVGLRGSSNNAAFIWDESDDVFAAILTTGDGSATTLTPASYAGFKAGAGTFSGRIIGNDFEMLDSGGTGRTLAVRHSGNQVKFGDGSTFSIFRFNGTQVIPHADSTATLGTSALRWSTVYGDNVNLSTLPSTTVNAAVPILFRPTEGTLSGDSALSWNPAADSLDVNGTVITSNYIRSSGANSMRLGSANGGIIMYLTATSRVGIGTDAPATLLDLRNTRSGSINGGTGHTGSVLTLHTEAQWESSYSTGGGNPDFLGGIEFSTGDSSTGEGVRAAIRASVDTYYNSNSLTFHTRSGANAIAERMRIKSDGKVGIGTAAPGAKLDIVGNSNTIPALKIGANATHGFSFYERSTEGDLRISKKVSGTEVDVLNIARSDGDVGFYNNVGIGTAAPGAKLDVVGAVHISPDTAGKDTIRFTTNAANDGRILIKSDTTTKVDIQANGNTYFNGGNISIGTTSSAYGRLFVDAATTAANTALAVRGRDSSADYLALNVMNNADSGLFAIYNSGKAYFSGSVGIGTTSPTSKLQIIGDASTNGLSIKSAANGGTYPFRVTWSGGTEGDVFCIDDNLRVGIGTTSPDFKLDLTETNASVNLRAIIQHTGSNQAGIDFKNSAQHVRLITDSTYPFRIYDQGDSADRFVLDTNGNIGIGTTTPTQLLNVYQVGNSGNSYFEGAAKIGGSTASLGAFLGYNSSGSGAVNLTNLNNTGGANAKIQLGFGAAIDSTPDTTVMTLNQSVKVGIGTTAPGATLDVHGSTVRISSTGGSYRRLMFFDSLASPSRNNFQVAVQEINNALHIGPSTAVGGTTFSGSTGLAMLADGKVGIGNSAPTKLLDVNGTAYFRDDIYFGNTVLNPASGFTAQTGMGWDKSTGALQISSSTTVLELGRHTSAGTALSIRYQSSQVASIESGGQIRSLSGGTSAPSFSFTNDTTTGMSRPTTGALNFITDATERVRIAADGNVGIGTTAPSADLHVSTTSGGELLVTRSGNSGVTLQQVNGGDAASGSLSIKAGTSMSLFTGGVDRMALESDGTLNLKSAKFKINGSAGNSGQTLTTDGSGNISWSSAGSGTISGSGTDHYVPRFNGTGALQNSSIFADDNGKVGIGAIPKSWNTLFDVLQIGYSGALAGRKSDNTIQMDVMNNVYYDGNFKRINAGHASRFTQNDIGDFEFFTAGTAAADSTITFSEKVTILNNGNVGIGVTAPGAKLHVNGGNIRISSTDDKPQLEFFETAAARWVIGHSNSPNNYFAISEGSDIASSERLVIAPSTGSVGIGTTAPSAPLQIYGSDNQLLKVTSTDAYAEICISDNTTTSTTSSAIGVHGNRLYLYTGGGQRLSVLGDGKVGIGTTAPSSLLTLQSSVGGAVDIFAIKADDGGNLYRVGKDANDHGYIELFDGASTPIKVRLNSSGSSYFNGGSVGIGTATPDQTFQVRVAANQNLRVRADSTAVQINARNDANSADVPFYLRGSLFNFQVGKVGIGTAAPYYDLDVRFTNNDTGFSSGDSGNWGGNGLRLQNLSTTVGSMALIQFRTSTAEWFIGNKFVSSNDSDFIFNHENSEKIRFTSDGKVGIGENAPAALLHLKGGTATDEKSHILFENTAGAKKFAIGGGGDGVTNNGLGFRNVTDNTLPMIIDDSGKVGIGITTPTTTLDVYHATHSQLTVSSPGNQDSSLSLIERTSVTPFGTANVYGFQWKYDGGDNKLYLSSGVDTNVVNRLTVQRDDGNVGIGTTAPAYALDVRSAGATTLQVKSAGNSDDTQLKLQSNAFFFNITNEGASGNITYVSDDNQDQIWYTDNASNTSVERFRIKGGADVDAVYFSNSNVGIGTTSPVQKLHVLGDAMRFERTNNAVALQLYNNNASPADDAALGYLQFMGKDNDGTASIVHSEVRGGVQSNTNSAVSGYLSFLTTNNGTSVTEAMRIKADGKVGIGTSAPVKKLDIRAAASWDGIHIGSTAGSATAIDFARSTTHANPTARIGVAEPAATHTSDMRFFTSDASGGAPNLVEKMRITQDGKVGIGTTAPNGSLDVLATGSASNPTIQVGFSTSSRANYRFGLYSDSEAGYISNKNGNNGIRFLHRGSTVMQVGYGGDASTPYVGIGTTTPDHKLHVAGTGQVAKIGDNHWRGTNTVTVGTTYATGVTVNLGNHKSGYLKVIISGDWSGHGAIGYMSEYFIQKGDTTRYSQPGTVIREVTNQHNSDFITTQILDPTLNDGNADFAIQFKTNTGSVSCTVMYEFTGTANSVT